MNTKSRTFKVAPEFEDIFTFETSEEKIEHRAQMISYRILSEIEKLCEEKNIKRKELAAMVSTSASYITQLFRGDKQVNTHILARFEEALDILFEVYLKRNDESHSDCLTRLFYQEHPEKIKSVMPASAKYFTTPFQKKDQTEELVEKMIKENEKKKLAA